MSPADVRRRRLAAVAVTAAVWLFLVAIWQVQLRIERLDRGPSGERMLYVSDGRLLRRLVLGFRDVAADLYWLRAIQQHAAEHRREDARRATDTRGNPGTDGGQVGPADPGASGEGLRHDATVDALAVLLDLATDLDPRLEVAYRYGAHFLGHDAEPGSPRPRKAIALLDKGIRANPRNWHLHFDKGFVYYFYLQEYRPAAEAFREGSTVPGAPAWMVSLAGRAMMLGGDRETARQLWQALHDTAGNDHLRQGARLQLRQLDALDAIDRLEETAARFRERTGRFPAHWQELVAAGLLASMPRDPAGVLYVLDAAEGRVRIAATSPLSAARAR